MMTVPSQGMAAPAAGPPGGCVLVGLGSAAGGAGGVGGAGGRPAPLQRLAAQLTALLDLPLLALLGQGSPEQQLAALSAAARDLSGGWLAPLQEDVGRSLADGSCWAQALGDWRQPVLLVIAEEQLASGLPAAGTALLRQWRVPLLGLLQWGGEWQPAARRRDGLPWLGLLPDPDGGDADAAGAESKEAELALIAALNLGWRRLAQL